MVIQIQSSLSAVNVEYRVMILPNGKDVSGKVKDYIINKIHHKGINIMNIVYW